jgi:hypothetical protein
MSFWNLPSANFRPRRYRVGNVGPWSGHLPFASDLIGALRPSLFVELGVLRGESYFGFCQAIEESQVACSCFGVDNWVGDPHAEYYGAEVFEEVSEYNAGNYAGFSYLVRSSFDDAAPQFSEESIDLLHIDGFHTYASVKHDFDLWFSKVKPGGIVLFHDIAVRHADFGVWRLWEELEAQHSTFAFTHSFGLGVLRKPGGEQTNGGILSALFDSHENPAAIRKYYEGVAGHLEAQWRLSQFPHAARDVVRPNCQLYYSREGQYSEQQSVKAPFDAGEWRQIRLDLPIGLGDGPLRLDVVDRVCVVDVADVRLVLAANDKPIWTLKISEEFPRLTLKGPVVPIAVSQMLRLFVFGEDPQLFLPELNIQCEEPMQLKVRIRVHSDLSPLVRTIQNGSAPAGNRHATLESELEHSHDLDERHARLRTDLEHAAVELTQSRAMVDQSIAWKNDLEHALRELAETHSGADRAQTELRRMQAELENTREALSLALRDVEQLRSALEAATAASAERAAVDNGQIEKLKSSIDLVAHEAQQLRAANLSMRAELLAARGEFLLAAKETECLRADLQSARSEAETFFIEKQQAETRYQVEAEYRQSMLRSGSWKITEPARILIHLLRTGSFANRRF